jgi:short-subunit dehydrogenase
VALPEPSPSATALVTGASSGIGSELARELARRGHHLTLVARREERLRSLAQEISQELGGEAETRVCDLADAEARERLVQELPGSGRSVEILVNNAGFGHNGDFALADTGRAVRMVRLNVEAVVDLCGRYLEGMVRRGRGAVLNVASTAAFQPLPGQAAYAASKSFVLSFSEAVRTELTGTGVTVTAVCPGPVRTEFMEQAGLGEVEERTPGAVWMSAGEVAREAVRGVEHGKRVVVPGALNRAGAIAGQHAPRAVALPLVRRLWSSL